MGFDGGAATCPRCHKQIPYGVRYCPFCQESLERSSNGIDSGKPGALTKEQLLSILNDQYVRFQSMGPYFDEISRWEDAITNGDARKKNGVASAIFLIGGVWGLLSGCLGIVASITEGLAISGEFSYVTFVGLMQSAIRLIVGIILLVLYFNSRKKVQAIEANKRERYTDTLQTLKAYYQEYGNKFIPLEYCNPYTLKGLIYIAQNYRVNSIPDVINTYSRVRASDYLQWMDSQTAQIEERITRSAPLMAVAAEVSCPIDVIVH